MSWIFLCWKKLTEIFRDISFKVAPCTVENKDRFPVRVKNTLIIPRNLFLALTSVPRFLTRFLCDLICCPIPCSVRGILFVPKLRPGELDFLQAYFLYPVSLLPMLRYPCHIAFFYQLPHQKCWHHRLANTICIWNKSHHCFWFHGRYTLYVSIFYTLQFCCLIPLLFREVASIQIQTKIGGCHKCQNRCQKRKLCWQCL